MPKFPKNVFIRRENDGKESYLLVEEELDHSNYGQEVAEYKLVRAGKTVATPVNVNWKDK